MKSGYHIDKEVCVNCGLCAEICLGYEKKEGQIQTVNPDLCIACGHCESVCPVHAIKGPQKVHSILNDKVLHTDELLNHLKNRRSIRKYTKEVITEEDMKVLLEAAKSSPTGSNEQNIEYVIINSQSKMSELRRIALPVVSRNFAMAKRIASLPFAHILLGRKQANRLKNVYGPAIEMFEKRNAAGDDRLFYNAPCLIAVHGEKQDEALAFSSHIALHNIALIAQTLGIGCLLNSFTLMAVNQNKEIKRWLNIPKENKCFGIMTLGYQNIKYHTSIYRKPLKVYMIK